MPLHLFSFMQDKSKFYVYSKKGCGYCTNLTEFLSSKKIPYESFELNEDFQIGEFVDKFGNNATFPQVHYENQNVGGMKNTVRFLFDNGFL